MLISGITGCGETHFVLDLIQHKYRNKFDYIVILCPTFIYNKTYNRPFIYKDCSIIPMPINDKLNSVLQEISNKFSDPKEHTLILLDDCANLHDAKMKSTALTKLAFHGRHSNISCWVITQKYNAIVKDFRQNIQVLVFFYDKDKKSRDAAIEKNDIGITPAEKNDIVRHLKTVKNSKLIMKLSHPFSYIY